MSTARPAAAVVAAALLLISCANFSTDGPRASRHPVAGFDLDGRASIKDGERSGAVSIYWEHRPQSDVIDFMSPLGQVLARLTGEAGGATLQMPDGERRRAVSAEILAEQLLGLRVPVARLRSWVQAVPGPRARLLRSDEVGRPALIAEDGWVVEYLSYAGPDAGAPVRDMQAVWGELEVRLLIDDWQVR